MSFDYTDFQRLVHAVPEEVNRALVGGRGGGKSVGLAQGIGIRAERYQERARILYLRQGPYKSLSDITETLASVFDQFWGPKRHSLNRSSMRWSLPTGSYFELGILPDGEEGRRYYERAYQGRSFSDVTVDESQQFSQPTVLDLLTSNLRGSIPTRMTIAANPGGIGHQWLVRRHVNAAEPWAFYDIETEVTLGQAKRKFTKRWINCPSTYHDNPHNGPDYLSNLAMSSGNDLDLLRAWLTGDWNISRGAYFADVLANPKIRIAWPDPSEWAGWSADGWSFWLAFDHGSAAPSVCYVMAKSPGSLGPDGRYYPHGSLLMLDEWACYRENDLSSAFGWHVGTISGHVRALAERWRLPAWGFADDACFADAGHEDGTIADEYAEHGVTWEPAHKGTRASRMLTIKRMMADAGNFEKPGLYVSNRCWYWWNTVPFLVYDPNNREVPKKCSTDHGLDAASYGLSGDAARGGVTENIA